MVENTKECKGIVFLIFPTLELRFRFFPNNCFWVRKMPVDFNLLQRVIWEWMDGWNWQAFGVCYVSFTMGPGRYWDVSLDKHWLLVSWSSQTDGKIDPQVEKQCGTRAWDISGRGSECGLGWLPQRPVGCGKQCQGREGSQQRCEHWPTSHGANYDQVVHPRSPARAVAGAHHMFRAYKNV